MVSKCIASRGIWAACAGASCGALAAGAASLATTAALHATEAQCAMAACAPPVEPAQRNSKAITATAIPWSVDRPLRWSDFRGAVPAPTPHAAFTECKLRITADVSITTTPQGNGWHCTVKLGPSSTSAVFEPSKSWSKPDLRSDALLAHEQIHFDLAHIQARRAAVRVVRDLGSRSFTAFAEDESRAIEAAQSKFNDAFTKLTREEHETLGRRNRQYDEETAHGMKSAEQQRWADAIARELRELGEAVRAPASAPPAGSTAPPQPK